MSRYSKKPLPIISGVQVTLAGSKVTVKGSKGELVINANPAVKVSQTGEILQVQPGSDDKAPQGNLVGLTYRLIQNMMKGVTEGFTKELDLNGVGYRMNLKGTVLNMQIGLSHEVNYDIPKGITVAVKGNRVSVTGVDKQLVGQVADNIRAFKPVEPYKAKGFKYVNEVVIRKAGKSGAKA